MQDQLHPDEIAITGDLVRALVDSQFPRFKDLPVTLLNATGSTNKLFRLGDDLLVRLPRQPGGGDTIDKEVHWLPELARHLPVDVPEILAVGKPALGYSERWSIMRWIDGTLAPACPPNTPADPGRTKLAADLADTVLALRAIDIPAKVTSDPSLRWYRGRPVVEFDDQMRKNLAVCHRLDGLDLDLAAVDRIWTETLGAHRAPRAEPDTWFHGDLVAENLLTRNGRLTGVLDFGGLAIGDPTIDLHGAWEIFDPQARDIFRRRLNIDDAAWARGRAWALAIAISVFSYYWTTLPKRCTDRLAMARNVLADAQDDR